MLLLNSFCNEVWYHIVSYLPNIKYFIRLWMINKELIKSYSANDTTFWISMVKYYCMINNKDFNELCSRLGIYNKGYDLIKCLFSYKKCSNSGCRKIFIEYDNQSASCHNHSGRLKPGGYLSCCHQKGFESIGCKQSYHNGFFHSMVYSKRLDNQFNINKDNRNINLSSTDKNCSSINNNKNMCTKLPNINVKSNEQNNCSNIEDIETIHKLEQFLNHKSISLPKII